MRGCRFKVVVQFEIHSASNPVVPVGNCRHGGEKGIRAQSEESPKKQVTREDLNQAAARIVKQITER
jgi:lauroyl/myristoyl acyltransferase